MHPKKLSPRYFRWLPDAEIDLGPDISIFRGANSSGKTENWGHAPAASARHTCTGNHWGQLIEGRDF